MGQVCDQNGLQHDDHHQHQVGVVVIPLPAQGHLYPLLQLSHHLSTTYNLPVHYLCSATHNRQAKFRSQIGPDPPNPNPNNTMIHFHDLQFHPNNSSSSPPHPNNNNTKFPPNIQHIIQNTYLLKNPISQLLQSLSSKYKKRLVVIHDSLMASVVVEDLKSLIPNSESYTFHTSSAFAIFFSIWETIYHKHKPLELGLDHVIDLKNNTIPSCKRWSSPEFEKFLAHQYRLLSFSSGRLYNTCKPLEDKYFDLLSQLPVNKNKKLYAVGPINALKMINSGSKVSSKTKHRCLDWLDEQEKDSVVYISFGTTTSMNEEQVRELAMGLERSQQKFIWVLRDADKVDIFGGGGGGGQGLPEGYEERVKGKGMVVRDWAPQLEILGHQAVGGFVSHCGWNSCMESLSMGVPIGAWPMHSDQPKNSFLVTNVLKVGVVVRDWGCNNNSNNVIVNKIDDNNEVVKASVVEKAITRLMASKEGREIRKRARELGVDVRGCASREGDSCLDMDSFVAHITR